MATNSLQSRPRIERPEPGTRLFSTDPTNAASWAAVNTTTPQPTGTQRLAAAILEQALWELIPAAHYPNASRQQRAAVDREKLRLWFCGRPIGPHDDPAHWPFAFRAICETLHLDADAVRARALHGVRPLEVGRMRRSVRAHNTIAGATNSTT